MSLCRGGLLGLVVSGCLWTGGTGSVEVVDDREILIFAERIEDLYKGLEGRSVDVLATYKNERFREFFASHEEFVDYYASLTSQLRAASFRHGRAQRIVIREFHFEGPDRARVEVTLIGRHLRGLRFWELSVDRTDTWRRRGSLWVLSPDRL
jgi:hypothetical protein